MRAGMPMVPMPRVTYSAAAPRRYNPYTNGVRKRAALMDWFRISTLTWPPCVARQRQIVSLSNRHRKDVGVVREQHVVSAGKHQPLGARQILALRPLVVHAGHVQYRAAKAQRPRRSAQKRNTQPRAFPFCQILNLGVVLVIPHASENAGIRTQARDLAETSLQRIAARGNQVAGNQRQVRAQLVGAVDHASQILLAQESAQMDVTQVQEAQSIQARREIGDRDFDLAHVEIKTLDERPVAHQGERRGQ